MIAALSDADIETPGQDISGGGSDKEIIAYYRASQGKWKVMGGTV